MMSTNPESISIFNELTLKITETLEKRKGVCDIKLPKRNGVDKAQILNWEKNSSCMMCDDLKNFYFTTNGLLLTWCVKLTADSKVPVGKMEINALDKLTRIGGASTVAEKGKSVPLLTDLADSDDESDTVTTSPRFDHKSRIFELDPCGGFGKVCYVYTNTRPGIPAQKPEIWFLDRSLNWHFLTDSFLGYFRLMLTHLGLPHWQYALTDIGLPPQAQQWFNMYCPSRVKLHDESLSITPSVSSSQLNPDRVFRGKGAKGKPGVVQNTRKKQNVPSANRSQNATVLRTSSQGLVNKPMR